VTFPQLAFHSYQLEKKKQLASGSICWLSDADCWFQSQSTRPALLHFGIVNRSLILLQSSDWTPDKPLYQSDNTAKNCRVKRANCALIANWRLPIVYVLQLRIVKTSYSNRNALFLAMSFKIVMIVIEYRFYIFQTYL